MERAIKTSALCAASALFTAPLPEFEEVRKNKRVGERSVFPFVCMWANSCMWVVYGLYIGDIFPTVLTNCVGFMFATYYCGVFVYALENPSRKAEVYNVFAKTILIVCTLCMMCFGGTITNLVSGLEDGKGGVVDDQVQKWMGLVAASSTVIQYASPLTALVKVVRRRSTEGLSGRLAVVSLVCGMLWLLYGIVTHDPFLYVPNTLGVAAALAQCLLFVLYPGRPEDDATNSPSKLKRKDSKPWRASPVRISAPSPTRPPRSTGGGARSPKGRSRTGTSVTAPARDLASVA